MSENKALSERVVIVTGGGRGIGSGISEVLAGAGAHVAIIYPAASEEVHAKNMIEKIEKWREYVMEKVRKRKNLF